MRLRAFAISGLAILIALTAFPGQAQLVSEIERLREELARFRQDQRLS